MYNHISNIVSFANLLLFPKMANSENAIIENYLNCRQQVLSELSSQELWNACNTDSEDNPLFFVAPTRSSYFAWGDISLKQFNKTTNSFTLLKTEILYLIPLPPAFRVNSYEVGYPEPITGYQPTKLERYEWTLELAKIIDSWLMAAVVYESNLLATEARLDVMHKIFEKETLFELCSTLKFSDLDCELTWSNRTEYSSLKTEILSKSPKTNPDKNFIDEGEIPNKPIELMNGISQALESYDLWNTCNTSERGEDLFFIPTIEDSSAFNWYLLDIEQDITILQELTEMLPGFIEVPCPPAFKPNQEQSNPYPTVGYQPSVKERYDWTLDLAKRLDAWLLATIFYGINFLSREDKLKTINQINTIGTIVELRLSGEFDETECRLNW